PAAAAAPSSRQAQGARPARVDAGPRQATHAADHRGMGDRAWAPWHSLALRVCCPLLDDLLDGVHAIGERGGSRLQDDRGLDLAQVARAHGWDLVPARSRGDTLRAELLAAP